MEIFPYPMTDQNSDDLNTPDLKTTRDGSHTLFSHRFDQHYHNPNGAVAESKHNFFEVNGLYELLKSGNKNDLVILEVGFGTGLNLLLLLDALQNISSNLKVHYFTIEAYPISPETAASFNYGDYLSNSEAPDYLKTIFGELNKGLNHFEIDKTLEVTVFYGLFRDFEPDNIQADFIFHDAFSPDVNEELWTGETFKKLKSLSSPDVILTTYSSASKAKGAMAWAGWKLAKAQGALGKREMTVAALDEKKLEGLKRVNEQRLAKRYEEGDF